MFRKTLGIAALAAASTLMLGSGTAFADSPWIETNDGLQSGGKARFNSGSPESIVVCDTEEDGAAAWAELSVNSNGRWEPRMKARAGGNGNCSTDSHDVAEGKEVRLTVYLLKDPGEPYGHAYWTGRA